LKWIARQLHFLIQEADSDLFESLAEIFKSKY